MRIHTATLVILTALAALQPARADMIGDIIEIAGREVRIFGIDAPEISQTCIYPDGEA